MPLGRRTVHLQTSCSKGCQNPAPCWTRQIQARPNQPWARCSVFIPPPASRGHPYGLFQKTHWSFSSGSDGVIFKALTISLSLMILTASSRDLSSFKFKLCQTVFSFKQQLQPSWCIMLVVHMCPFNVPKLASESSTHYGSTACEYIARPVKNNAVLRISSYGCFGFPRRRFARLQTLPGTLISHAVRKYIYRDRSCTMHSLMPDSGLLV